MAVIEIVAQQRSDDDSGWVGNWFIDAPVKGESRDAYSFQIDGWVVGRTEKVIAIEIVNGMRTVAVGPPTLARSEVAARFPECPGAATAGFSLTTTVIGLPSPLVLEVRALGERGSRARLATITVTHRPLQTTFNGSINPLLVTSLGRTGTTWLMRLLAQHPALITFRVHPYEMRPAKYWAHQLAVIAGAPEAERTWSWEDLSDGKGWARSPLLYLQQMRSAPQVRAWLDKGLVENWAEHGQRCIEDCYRAIAAQSSEAPRFFIEKHLPDRIAGLLRELYPHSREIFLVRDFRDMICSIDAFNAKRQRPAFGREYASGDDQFIAFQRSETARLLQSWQERASRSMLLRYEDLVTNPRESLGLALEYIGVDADPKIVDAMVSSGSVDLENAIAHRTSTNPAASIGRWKSELQPGLRAACASRLDDVLTAFGYPPTDDRPAAISSAESAADPNPDPPRQSSAS